MFSTFYEDDLKTPCEGVCQILHLGKIYERRTFVKGRLTEEILNTFEGKPRVRSKFSIWDNDSLLIDQKVYYENGTLQTHNIYYLNQERRRCLKTVEYGLKGQKRFERSYASNGIKISALHTILDSLHGPYQELDSTGMILIDYRYKAGLRHGWCRQYAADGRLIFERFYEMGIPNPKYTSIHKRKDLPSLTLETKQGLERLIKIQRIDSLLFSKKEIEAIVFLAYQHFSEQFEPLPQTDYNGLRDFHHTVRIHLRRTGQMIFMDMSAYASSSVTFIIYPDMEIEIFNQRYTKEELNTEQMITPKYYMWNDWFFIYT